MTRTFPPPWIALFVAYGLGVTGALGDLPRSPEHEAHLFFADHAWRDWWGRLDPRWYAGLDVTCVPLLSAQLVALTAKLPGVGLERAYALIVGLAGGLAGLGAVRVARALAPDEVHGRGWLTVAAAACPLLWVGLIPQGSLPGVLALGFALNAAAWARSADPLASLAGAACAGAAVASHPIGLLVVGLAVVPLAARWTTAAALVVGAALGLGVAWGPLQLMWGSSAAPAPGVGAAHLLTVSLAVGVAALAARRRAARLVVVAVGAAGLGALAPQGGTVVPPPLALAGALTLALALAAALEPAPRWTGLLVAALVFAATAATLGWHRNADTRSRRAALRDVEWVLANAADGERFRFVSLGIGREWLELSRRVRPHALDGALDWLHPSWDALRADDPQARARLTAAVGDAGQALRWVIVGAPGWDDALLGLGFRNVGAWRGNVTLWQRDAATPLEPAAVPWQRAPWTVVVLGPLLGAAALLAALVSLRALRATPAASP